MAAVEYALIREGRFEVRVLGISERPEKLPADLLRVFGEQLIDAAAALAAEGKDRIDGRQVTPIKEMTPTVGVTLFNSSARE